MAPRNTDHELDDKQVFHPRPHVSVTKWACIGYKPVNLN